MGDTISCVSSELSPPATFRRIFDDDNMTIQESSDEFQDENIIAQYKTDIMMYTKLTAKTKSE